MTRTTLEMEFVGAALGWVERELEMTDLEIGQAMGVDRKTIDRWRKRESAPTREQRKRLEKLAQLKRLLEPRFERLAKANGGSANRFRAPRDTRRCLSYSMEITTAFSVCSAHTRQGLTFEHAARGSHRSTPS